MTRLLRGDACYHPVYGAGVLWGWDTDYTGVYGASRYVTVKLDTGIVIVLLRDDVSALEAQS